MKRIDFTLIADVAFYGIAVWFLAIGILRYYRMGLALAAIIASLVALAFAGIILIVALHSHHRRRLNKREAAAQEALFLHLALEKEERVLTAFETAFRADGKAVTLHDNALLIEDTMCVPRFTLQPLSADETAHVIRAFGRDKLTILCNALTPEAEKLAASFGVKVMRKNEIYKLFTRTETTPDPLILAELPRKNIRRTLRRIVSKKSARPFFTSGVLLLIMSLFTFFPVYYIVSGSILLFCAICVRLLGYTA